MICRRDIPDRPSGELENLSSGGGSTLWGDITGTLSDQADLQVALDGKAAVSHTHDYTEITNTPADDNFGALSTGSPVGTDFVSFFNGIGYLKVAIQDLPVAGGGTAWGSISGTLSDQTDLQVALDGKAAVSHTHDYTEITNTPANNEFGLLPDDPNTPASLYLHTFDNDSGLYHRLPMSTLFGDWINTYAAISWGVLDGNLSDQADLQVALDGKAAVSHTHDYTEITNTPADDNFGALSTGSPVGTDFVSFFNGIGYLKVAIQDLPVAGGGAAWGDITGTLSDQTDLQSILDTKIPKPATETVGYGLFYDGTDYTHSMFYAEVSTNLIVNIGNSTTTSDQANIIGHSNSANGSNITILSHNFNQDYNNITMIGSGVDAIGSGATAVGRNALAAQNGTAVGIDSQSNIDGVAIGRGAQTSEANAVAIGRGSMAQGTSSVSIGHNVVHSFPHYAQVGRMIWGGSSNGFRLAEIIDLSMPDQVLNVSLDEATNTLKFKFKKSTGDIIAGTIAMS